MTRTLEASPPSSPRPLGGAVPEGNDCAHGRNDQRSNDKPKRPMSYSGLFGGLLRAGAVQERVPVCPAAERGHGRFTVHKRFGSYRRSLRNAGELLR